MSDINVLREHLFAALQGVKDGSLDLDRAKAISEISQTIINTAKVEVDYCKAVGGQGTGFIDSTTQQQLPKGVTGMKRIQGAF